MNKTELIEAMSKGSCISRGEAKKGLDAFMEVVTSALEKGEKVALVGFGTFCIEKKNARVGRDPRNGAPIKIPARCVVKFRPGQELSELVK